MLGSSVLPRHQHYFWLLWGMHFLVISLFYYQLNIDFLLLENTDFIDSRVLALQDEIVIPLFKMSFLLFCLFVPVLISTIRIIPFWHQCYHMMLYSLFQVLSIASMTYVLMNTIMFSLCSIYLSLLFCVALYSALVCQIIPYRLAANSVIWGGVFVVFYYSKSVLSFFTQ